MRTSLPATISSIDLSVPDKALLALLISEVSEEFRPKPGLYFLWDEGSLVYTGKSDCSVQSRIKYHIKDRLNKFFEEVSIFYAETGSEHSILSSLESSLIARFAPKFNKCHLATASRMTCACCGEKTGNACYGSESYPICGRCHIDHDILAMLKARGLVTKEGIATLEMETWLKAKHRSSILAYAAFHGSSMEALQNGV